MTEQKRLALHEWGLDGNSVYKNSSMGTGDRLLSLTYTDTKKKSGMHLKSWMQETGKAILQVGAVSCTGGNR